VLRLLAQEVSYFYKYFSIDRQVTDGMQIFPKPTQKPRTFGGRVNVLEKLGEGRIVLDRIKDDLWKFRPFPNPKFLVHAFKEQKQALEYIYKFWK